MEKRAAKYANQENTDNRYGVFWTDEEDSRLLSEFKSGVTIQQISESHKRTPKAVEIRLAKLASWEIYPTDDSTEITRIAAKYRVTESMVIKELKFLQKRAAKAARASESETTEVVPRLNKKELVQKILALEKRVEELSAVISMQLQSTSK